MDGRENKEKRSDNRAVNLFALRAAVSAYLCYLGFDLLRAYLVGASTLSGAVAWGCGLGFMGGGLAFALYSWRRYRRETSKRADETGETGKTPDEE